MTVSPLVWAVSWCLVGPEVAVADLLALGCALHLPGLCAASWMSVVLLLLRFPLRLLVVLSAQVPPLVRSLEVGWGELRGQ